VPGLSLLSRKKEESKVLTDKFSVVPCAEQETFGNAPCKVPPDQLDPKTRRYLRKFSHHNIIY